MHDLYSGRVGFSLRVGGGLSTRPHLAERLDAFVRPDQALAVVKGVSEIFRDSDGLRQNREKARLKFRGSASSFAVVTGHEDPAKGAPSVDWARLATAVDTLVVRGPHAAEARNASG